MDPATLALILAAEQIVERWLVQKAPPDERAMNALAEATAAARKAAEARAEALGGPRAGSNAAGV